MFSAAQSLRQRIGRTSHVLEANEVLSKAQAKSSIRSGFARYTTPEEIEEAAGKINAAAKEQDFVKVEFETARGETVTAEAQPGDNLLGAFAQAAGLPLRLR